MSGDVPIRAAPRVRTTTTSAAFNAALAIFERDPGTAPARSPNFRPTNRRPPVREPSSTQNRALPPATRGGPRSGTAPRGGRSGHTGGGKPRSRRTPRAHVLGKGFVSQLQEEGKVADAEHFMAHLVDRLVKDGLGLEDTRQEAIRGAIRDGRSSHPRRLLLKPEHIEFLRSVRLEVHEFLEEQEDLRQVVRLQSAVRMWRARRRFLGLEGKQRDATFKRNEKFLELFRTEKEVVESLKDLIDLYMMPLRHNGVLEPQESARIFSNVETIYAEHSTLYRRLEEAQKDWPALGNVGAIFLDIKSLLNAISIYVTHFQSAINEIQRLEETHPPFKDFLDHVYQETEVELPTALLLPVNRISQYEFYLRALADTIPAGSPERQDCENAFAALAQSSLMVQQCLVESTNVAGILQIQQQVRAPEKGPFSLLVPGRKVMGDFRFKKHYVCLFNDAVLVARRDHRAISTHMSMNLSKGREAKELFRVKGVYPIMTTELVADSKTFELKVEGHSPSKFTPLMPEDKPAFVRAYNRIRDEINRIKVFGVQMVDTIVREERDSGIPMIVEILTAFIEKRGAEQAGIFRVAGSSVECKAMQAAFDAGETDPAVLRLEDYSIFSVCDVLKQYFRSLPEPMLGYRLYEPIVKLMRDTDAKDSERKQKIQESLFHWTPPFAIKVLRFLMAFLHRIAQHSDENKMTSNNLAIVFGPTLLWAEHNSLEAAMDMPYINGAVQVIIDNYENILQ